MDVKIRKLNHSDYEGVLEVDVLTMKQYLKEKWERLPFEEQQRLLVVRKLILKSM